MARLEELSKLSSYLRFNPDENWKCIKAGLRPDIIRLVGPMEIRDFPTLVNKCRIVEGYGGKEIVGKGKWKPQKRKRVEVRRNMFIPPH